MKSRSLQGVNISSRLGLVGDLQRKSATYDLYALKPTLDDASGNDDPDNAEEDAAAAHVDVGAEELSSLSVLLPCKRKGGRLYLCACTHAPGQLISVLLISSFLLLSFGGRPRCVLCSPKACHATPYSRSAAPEARKTRPCLRFCYLCRPSPGGVPRGGVDAPLPTVRRPRESST